MALIDLIRKYSTSGPRYTSYPTAPQWTGKFGPEEYRKQLASGFLREGETLGLYIHLPFCQSLCYYCGCNIQITNNKSRSRSYVDSVIRELNQVADGLGPGRALSQISWGGGTPTFLSLEEMEQLHEATRARFAIAEGADVSVEVDPRVTSAEQLELLARLGFTRVSLGVQDFDSRVQKAINRIQPEKLTGDMLERCRKLGFRGINFDLIYGLPHQDLKSFERTIDAVVRMRPDRIAMYNYARLPDMLKHQRILEKYPMPEAEERVEIFIMAFEKLTAAGYGAIGMDHFSLKDDSLFQAIREGRLYRNFMGYVVRKATNLIGLGASAIGEVGDGYFQNVRGPKEYEERIAGDGLAVFRGHRLSPEDKLRKWVIQKIMCQFEVPFAECRTRFGVDFRAHFAREWEELDGFVADGIVEKAEDRLRVTELGRIFIRNLAMIFDEHLKRQQVTYSRTV